MTQTVGVVLEPWMMSSDKLGAGDDNASQGNDQESSKRSERKRQREKQRRSDLSGAFDELAAFIVQVEPDSLEDDNDKKKRRKSDAGGSGEDAAGITRLDLIGRAVRIMKRLHRENEERKRIIAGMEGRGGGANNDNVIVMVPTLAPAGDEPPPVARASYPGSYHHQHHSNPAMPSYYPSPASSLSASAAAYGADPRDYSMPAPHHHAASSGYGSQWPGYGRSHQPGMSHHLGAAGLSSMRHLQHQYPSSRPPGSSPDGMSHLPPEHPGH